MPHLINLIYEDSIFTIDLMQNIISKKDNNDRLKDILEVGIYDSDFKYINIINIRNLKTIPKNNLEKVKFFHWGELCSQTIKIKKKIKTKEGNYFRRQK